MTAHTQTQCSKTGYVCRERYIKPELLRLWAARCPMTQLPDEYRVTESRRKPTLVHFAIPLDAVVIYKYAFKNNLICTDPPVPDMAKAVEYLSQRVEYELVLYWPFKPTADCGLIFILYDNYTMDDKMLIDEDQEDVIQMVQEELGLDKSVRPKWYFDWEDPWRPGTPEEEMDSDNDEDRGEHP